MSYVFSCMGESVWNWSRNFCEINGNTPEFSLLLLEAEAYLYPCETPNEMFFKNSQRLNIEKLHPRCFNGF